MLGLSAALRSSLSPSAALPPARAFSSSARALDLAKVTLIGRLGQDPILRQTSSGKPYYVYSVATSTGPPREDEGAGGKPPSPSTSWHTIFAFNEHTHPLLGRIGKGSAVYVEAELDMRPVQSADGQNLHDRALLKHQTMRVITRVRPEEAGAEGAGEAFEE